MSIVVDASFLVVLLADTGEPGDWAESLVETEALYAPELALVETTNILRRQERFSELSTHEATAAHRDLGRLTIELFPFAPFAERVWSLRSNLTSYDAWYVALAEALELPLATLDRRLAHAPGLECELLLPQ